MKPVVQPPITPKKTFFGSFTSTLTLIFSAGERLEAAKQAADGQHAETERVLKKADDAIAASHVCDANTTAAIEESRRIRASGAATTPMVRPK